MTTPIIPAKLNTAGTHVKCGSCGSVFGEWHFHPDYVKPATGENIPIIVVIFVTGITRDEKSGVWRLSHNAKQRMRAGKTEGAAVRQARADRMPYPQSRIAVLRGSKDLNTWLQSHGASTGYDLPQLDDRLPINEQTDVPCDVQCPRCDRINRVTRDIAG